MLLQVRDFIFKAGVASSQQLAREFQIDELALQPMLDFWLRKKLIKKCGNEPSCKAACLRCKTPTEYYQEMDCSE